MPRALVVVDAARIGLGGNKVHAPLGVLGSLLGGRVETLPGPPRANEIIDGLEIAGGNIGLQDEGIFEDDVGAAAWRGHEQLIFREVVIHRGNDRYKLNAHSRVLRGKSLGDVCQPSLEVRVGAELLERDPQRRGVAFARAPGQHRQRERCRHTARHREEVSARRPVRDSHGVVHDGGPLVRGPPVCVAELPRIPREGPGRLP